MIFVNEFSDITLKSRGWQRSNLFQSIDFDPQIIAVVLDLIEKDRTITQKYTLQSILKKAFQDNPDNKQSFHSNFTESGNIEENLQIRSNWEKLDYNECVKNEKLLLRVLSKSLQRKIVCYQTIRSNLELDDPVTFGEEFRKSFAILGYFGNHNQSYFVSAIPIRKLLSKSKPLIMTDGVAKVGIVVDSFEGLEENAKLTLNLPPNIEITFKTEQKMEIQNLKDVENLNENEILTIIPKGPIDFTPDNLLMKLTIDPKNIFLFTDRDFVTLSEINIEEFEERYDRQRLEGVKEIANDHVAKDQELRDTLDLVHLSKTQGKGSESPKTSVSEAESAKRMVMVDCKDVLEKVKKDYGKIFKASDEELQCLASMDEGPYELIVEQIKTAASRRLRIKRQMETSKQYLLSKKLKSEVDEADSSQSKSEHQKVQKLQ